MNLNDIKRSLRDMPTSVDGRDSETIKCSIRLLKTEAVSSGNESFANALWAYGHILELQDNYLIAFNLMRDREFYAAWCQLATVETYIRVLRPHYRSAYNGFYIDFIDEYTRRFQSLYPYRLFFSIEAIVKARSCGICGAKIFLRTSCQHKPGELYFGEYCYRVVEKLELPGISVVESPADKSCVVFKSVDGKPADDYDYTLVQYPISKLATPLDKWNYEKTTIRHPHSYFSDFQPEDGCPCGSEIKYKDCCLLEHGVLQPHFQFHFDRVNSDQKFELIYKRGTDTKITYPELSENNADLLRALTLRRATTGNPII